MSKMRLRVRRVCMFTLVRYAPRAAIVLITFGDTKILIGNNKMTGLVFLMGGAGKIESGQFIQIKLAVKILGFRGYGSGDGCVFKFSE